MPDLKNCHFPGLYSIVLEESPGPLYRRVYITPPLGGHRDLRIRNSKFLIHDHKYDFTSRTLVGIVVNRIFLATNSYIWIGVERLHEHDVSSGIIGEFDVRPTGRVVRAVEDETTAVPAGSSYSMTADQFHAVEFHPDSSGWCVVEITETRRRDRLSRASDCFHPGFADGFRSGFAYSSIVHSRPAAGLYEPLKRDERARLLSDLAEATGISLC